MSNFQKEKKLLKKHLGFDIVNLLKTSKAILAGGALTSIFSGKEINDFDVYFRSYEDLVVFIKNVYNKEELLEEDQWCDLYYALICVNHTNRSILFTKDEVKLQAIHFSFYEKPEDIFKSFDFTVNMAAFDFSTDEFVFHGDFFKDLSKRRLTFNHKTDYPIISSLRVNKYIDRGYKISKKEMFKISLAIADIKIDSWDKLEDHLSGFYGVDVSKLFDKTKDFSLVDSIEMLDLVEEDITHSVTCQSPNYKTLVRSVENYHNTSPQSIYYKFVIEAEDGRLVSPYHKGCSDEITYSKGSTVNGGVNGVYAYESKDEINPFNFRTKKKFIVTLETLSPKNIKFNGDTEAQLLGDVKVIDVEEMI